MVSRAAIVCLLGAALAAGGCDRPSAANGQAEATAGASADEVPAGAGSAAPARAGVVDRSHAGAPAPAVSFTAPDGRRATLADFRGRPVLVNLWATWCAPCVKEMPTLDAAARALAGRVPVIAVSQDMKPAKAKAFLAERRFGALKPYLDPELGLSLALEANLPTTILYDREGREQWRVTGDRDWSSAETLALLGE